jgi:hypothetical protein
VESTFVYRNRDGVRRTLISDDADPFRVKVKTEVNMDEILEGVKRDRENHLERSDNKLLARVPMTIFEQSIHEQWDEADWKKWLNDPDNDCFRVWRGQV